MIFIGVHCRCDHDIPSSLVKPRSNQTLHDTHQVVSQQKHHTPAELTRIKFERDQQLLQQQMLLDRRRQQEMARQQVILSHSASPCSGELLIRVFDYLKAPRSGQLLSVPNIAQQPRMGVAPISAAQPSSRGPGITQAQQQNALLQTQRNGQVPESIYVE